MYSVPSNATTTVQLEALRSVDAPGVARAYGTPGGRIDPLAAPRLYPRADDGRYPGIVRLFRAPLTREKELRLAAAWKKQYPEEAARIAASRATDSAPCLRPRTSPFPAQPSRGTTRDAVATPSPHVPGIASDSTPWRPDVATSAIQCFAQFVEWSSAQFAALDRGLGQLIQLPGAQAARTSPDPASTVASTAAPALTSLAGSSITSPIAAPPAPSPSGIASACSADGCDISALLEHTAYGVLEKAKDLGFELLPYRPTAGGRIDPRRPPHQIPVRETLLILGELHEHRIIARAIQALVQSLRSNDAPMRLLIEGTPEETAALWAKMRGSQSDARLEVIGIDARGPALQDAMARLMRGAVRFSRTFHKFAPDHVPADLAGKDYSHKTGAALETAWQAFIADDAFNHLAARDQAVLARDRIEYVDALVKADELASSRERDDALLANIRRQRSREGITVVILGAKHLAACQVLTVDQEAYLLVHQNAKSAIGMS